MIESATIFKHHTLVEIEARSDCLIDRRTAQSRVYQLDRPYRVAQSCETHVCRTKWTLPIIDNDGSLVFGWTRN